MFEYSELTRHLGKDNFKVKEVSTIKFLLPCIVFININICHIDVQ